MSGKTSHFSSEELEILSTIYPQDSYQDRLVASYVRVEMRKPAEERFRDMPTDPDLKRRVHDHRPKD